MKASRENIGISHLLFANDLVLFARVSEVASVSIKGVLNRFYEESRQMISYGKSRIYFSPNTPSTLKEQVSDT